MFLSNPAHGSNQLQIVLDNAAVYQGSVELVGDKLCALLRIEKVERTVFLSP